MATPVRLLDYVTNALIESDKQLFNDLEPWDYYEVKAEAAIMAYEDFATGEIREALANPRD